MKLNNLIKDLRRDKRMKEWNARHSTGKEYKEDLRSLPDLSNQAENMIGDTQEAKNTSTREVK